MGRKPCCDKVGLKRGPWTMEEDQKLIDFILNNGIQCWRLVPKLAGLMRCGKSCRLRWINYLRPDLKRGDFSEDEEDILIELHSRLGNRWSKIASHFPGRTDNEIKNHWNTRIKKKLKLQGIDPITHEPIKQSEDGHDSVSNITVDDENKVLDANANATSQDKNKIVPPSQEKEENNNEAILNADGRLHETINLTMDGECSVEGSSLCWDAIDSFPSWEAMYYLEDVLFFMNDPLVSIDSFGKD
ncbi:uncharacterized protein A4U43_C02F9590 [Asparagus officinalis]|uniref:Uncharacterized protein n=1 Tax=Asparagus officinalis TaxID=4686 RepID=A0A5P1FHA3_ASPOF|nr:protein ODORANT1-like [Asparagus officinalis]ONK77698.1 uncharacterized protein A4U43_C02F9590 [Asparagus officinalis]